MADLEHIMSIPKSEVPEASKALNKEDISQLVEWLSSKDDSIRYQAFLLLQHRSAFSNDVYPFWDVFRDKLASENSYQRSIGLMLIADNAKWDTENKTENTIDEYLQALNDEKPIPIRQCIQSLEKIAAAKPALHSIIASGLVSFDIMAVKETMQKSILTDILHVLLTLRQTEEIEGFILNALSGEILDKKQRNKLKRLSGRYNAFRAKCAIICARTRC